MTTVEGASVFVTGGSRGIGKAIALRFARLGAARVAFGYLRSDSAAEETAGELAALGAEPVLVRGNISSDRVLEEVGLLGWLMKGKRKPAKRKAAEATVEAAVKAADISVAKVDAVAEKVAAEA